MVETTAGRPRNRQIDDAVLAATIDALESVGYLQLTIAGVAHRARTSKPAIYRRWPTKAHLVHAAVFPARDAADFPADADLRGEIRALVESGLNVLGTPAARAALPGLLADTSADGSLAADVFGRAAGAAWSWLHERLAARAAAGEVRSDVDASTVFELIAGATFVAMAIGPTEYVDDAWIQATVELIVRGIVA